MALFGFCPKCDMGEGLNPARGKRQRWREAVSVLTAPPLNGPADLSIPKIVMGEECKHTISLRAWREYNRVQ